MRPTKSLPGPTITSESSGWALIAVAWACTGRTTPTRSDATNPAGAFAWRIRDAYVLCQMAAKGTALGGAVARITLWVNSASIQRQIRDELADLLSPTDEMSDELEKFGELRYRAGQLCEWIYKKRVSDFSAMSNMPAALRARLGEHFQLRPLEKVKESGSKDTTRKFLPPQRRPVGRDGSHPSLAKAYGERSDRRTISYFQPGGVRLRVQILREWAGRLGKGIFRRRLPAISRRGVN